MELNIGMSEWNKNVDNYNGRNFESHAAPAERLSTVSSPFLSYIPELKQSWIKNCKKQNVFEDVCGIFIFVQI